MVVVSSGSSVVFGGEFVFLVFFVVLSAVHCSHMELLFACQVWQMTELLAAVAALLPVCVGPRNTYSAGRC